jgi:hypothetical protein
VRELNYQLKQLCRRNRDGSYRTQADRERQLTLIANQLHALGYRRMNARSLKPKHVEALRRGPVERSLRYSGSAIREQRLEGADGDRGGSGSGA